jgi:hypothetical protein
MGKQDDVIDARRRGNQIVTTVTCAQCGTSSTGRWRRWRACRSDNPEFDEPPTLAFFCPACAEREFDG